MIERLRERLAELRQEYLTGEARLRELARQQAALRETMLRISGAIQVLQELVTATTPGPAAAPGQPSRGDDGAPDGPPPEPKVVTVP